MNPDDTLPDFSSLSLGSDEYSSPESAPASSTAPVSGTGNGINDFVNTLGSLFNGGVQVYSNAVGRLQALGLIQGQTAATTTPAVAAPGTVTVNSNNLVLFGLLAGLLFLGFMVARKAR